MMNEEIRLERTEIVGHITLIPTVITGNAEGNIWREVATALYDAWLDPTGDEVPMRKALEQYEAAAKDE